MLNNLLHRNKYKEKSIDQFISKNNSYTDKSDIVNIFNDYFSTAPNEIARSLPARDSYDFRAYLTGSYPNSFYLKSITFVDIINIIDKMKITNSWGLLGIPIKVLKSLRHVFPEYLTWFFNRCIGEGYFPDKLKVVEIISNWKADNRALPGNYRPISILTVFSKISLWGIRRIF